MSEVKRFSEGRFSGFGTEHPQGCWVRAEDFDRITAERDAALGREAALIEKITAIRAEHDDRIKFRNIRCDELQQRLTAADEALDKADDEFSLMSLEAGQRIDVLEGLLRDSKDVMSGIWDTSYDHEAGDALAALDLMGRIDAALKPAEGGGDE